jgi:hypothetical protein
MKPKKLVNMLAFAAVFLAVLLPPEAYPDGKLAVILCATFAFIAGVIERRIHPAYIKGGLAAFAFLIFHSLFISVDAYRSLEFLSVLWAYYCLFGFFLYAGFEPEKPFSVSIVVLCAIVSGYGLYQYFWGFDQLYNYISYAGSDKVVKTPALERIATRRVFSTLALPGTLWGFLTIALPFHARLWRGSGRFTKALLAAGIAMLLATGLLTRSFGFLVGLFLLAATWFVLHHRRAVWRIAPVLIVLALVAILFYSLRRGGIEASNPVFLRAQNWISAWTIFAAHPLGTGLNTYGVMYSQYMLPGANETQYTHNTPLQLLSELGYSVLIAGACLLLLALRSWRRGEFKGLPTYLLLALVVWAGHNLIDINVYFPSLGVIGAVLLGTMLRKPSVAPQPQTKFGTPIVVVLGLLVLTFGSLVMVSSELQVRAQGEYEENRLLAAAQTLETATAIMPFNSSLFHDSGDVNLNLFHSKHDARYLDIATKSFQRAIALSPEKSGPHIGLGLCLSSGNRIDDALIELRDAQRLSPDSAYVQAIARLIEKRKSETANKPTPPVLN